MLKQLFTKTLDAVAGWTDCVATRVPLRRASGPDEVTLDLPGYVQLDSYGCGAVAGVMALKHFKPRASFTAFYARVSPHPENGTATYRLIRALRQSGLRVSERHDLSFADLCLAIDTGSPIIVVVHTPLFLKRDNGSVFNDHAMESLLAYACVLPLNSPNACPRYNGAIEKGVRDMKASLLPCLPAPRHWQPDHVAPYIRAVLHLENSKPRRRRAAPARVPSPRFTSALGCAPRAAGATSLSHG